MPVTEKFAIGSFVAAAGFALTATLILLLVSGASLFPVGDSRENTAMTNPTEEMSSDPDQISSSSVIQAATESSVVPTEPYLVGIVPSPRIVNINGTGSTQKISVQGLYSDGAARQLEPHDYTQVTFTSSDPGVAQVDLSGILTGVNFGGTDVSISYGGHKVNLPVMIWGPIKRIPPLDPRRLLEIEEYGPTVVLNRILLELDSAYDEKDADEIATTIGGAVIFEFRTFPGYIVEFGATTAAELDEALLALYSDSRVVSAYPDSIMHRNQGPNVSAGVESMLNAESQAYEHAGLFDAWTALNDNPLQFETVIIAVIDDEFANITAGQPGFNLIVDEFDNGIINRIDASNPRLSTTPTPDFSKSRIHIMDLVVWNH